MQIPPATPLSSSSPLLGPVWPLLGGWWGGGGWYFTLFPISTRGCGVGLSRLGLVAGCSFVSFNSRPRAFTLCSGSPYLAAYLHHIGISFSVFTEMSLISKSVQLRSTLSK